MQEKLLFANGHVYTQYETKQRKNFIAVICTYIYIQIIQFHLYHRVNIYSNCLQEQFCNLSLYTLYILSVQQIFKIVIVIIIIIIII